MPGAETNLLDKAQALFEHDPLLGYVTIVVAGNARPGAQTVPIVGFDGKSHNIMLPDWDADAWRWWIGLGLAIVDAANEVEAAEPSGKLDMMETAELASLYGEARSIYDQLGQAPKDQLTGNDEIGWVGIAARVLLGGGRLLMRNAKRVSTWAAPKAKKFAKAAWGTTKALFAKAPFTITASVAMLAAPDVSTKAIKAAAEVVSTVLGGAAKGIVSGLGPLGIILIGGLLYYAFRGKGAAD